MLELCLSQFSSSYSSTYLIAQPLVHHICLHGATTDGLAKSNLNLDIHLSRNHGALKVE
jgi:hypothetical protein